MQNQTPADPSFPGKPTAQTIGASLGVPPQDPIHKKIILVRKGPPRLVIEVRKRTPLPAAADDAPAGTLEQPLPSAPRTSQPATAVPQEPLIVRRSEIRALSGLPNSTMYDKLNPKSPRHDPKFPKPIKLGARAVGFWRHEVVEWLSSRGRTGEQ